MVSRQTGRRVRSVLRESSNLLIEFTKLVWQEPAPAPDGANVPTPIDWRPWNEALAVIDLVADHTIVEGAYAIDEQIWRVHQQVKRGWIPVGCWLEAREHVDARQQDFVNIARRRLAAKGPPLSRLTGRPPSDSPIWEFRRSYFIGDGQDTSQIGSSALDQSEPTSLRIPK